ncbi:MAG: FtsQ-type POTRA domain-containing protein [Candidatus Andersenbacteria bacterium]|nr:FtsQ-type POTRA domain-containing protein [Candidatus Andersenbacteria bacterium]
MRIPFGDMNQARLKQGLGVVGRVLSALFLALLLVVPIAWFFWFIFFTDTFTVRAVTVVDAREHTATAVQQILEEKLGKNMFWLQTPVLEQKILLSVPQVRDVHIVRTLPDTLKVVVQEKEPVLLLLSQRKYYFIDAGGIAYEEARLETLPGTLLPIVKNNDEGGQLTLGVPVVDQRFLGFLQYVQRELPGIAGAELVETRIPSLAAREVHFHLNNNWEIRLDITREPQGQLAILRKLLQTTIPDDKKSQIEYIDLRIPQRVYYKLRGAIEKPSPTI